MNPPLLQLTPVTKSFGAVRVLMGVSFDLRAGEVLQLPGENGVGKGEICSGISGAHQSAASTVEIHGQRVAFFAPVAGSLRSAVEVRTVPAKLSRS